MDNPLSRVAVFFKNLVHLGAASTPNFTMAPSSTYSKNFVFHEPLVDDSDNGLYLHDFYLPEEVVLIILSYLEPQDALSASLVCKKWCNLIKSYPLWALKFNRTYHKRPKKLPWYVLYCRFTNQCFDQNLIKNGNGEEQLKHWIVLRNYGDEIRVEDPPSGSDPLPQGVKEFNGKTSCFATSYYEGVKMQDFDFETNNLMRFVLDNYKPHIYVSEWVAGRFDCGCSYRLVCNLYGPERIVDKTVRETDPNRDPDGDDDESDFEEYYNELGDETPNSKVVFSKEALFEVEQWKGNAWSKVEILVQDYPAGINRIAFVHEGKDTQFWKGHYGSKMAGGVLKILFDSIEPLKEEDFVG